MNKNKERMGEETKDKNRDDRREGDEGAAQKARKKNGWHAATDGNIRSQEEATQQRDPPDWNIREDAVASGQAHGTRTGPSAEKMHPDWNIQGAECLEYNIQGRSGPGLERPGLHKEEKAAAAKKGKENMNKSEERMREATANMNREGEEGDQGAAQKGTTDNRQSKKEKEGRHGATDWSIRGPEELPLYLLPPPPPLCAALDTPF